MNYATKASYISNEPVKNVDPKTRVMKALKSEVSMLKKELLEANRHIDILTNVIESRRGGDDRSSLFKERTYDQEGVPPTR